jgi:hypothetical protein
VNALLVALRQGKSLIPAFSLKRYTQDVEAARISRGPGSFCFATKSALKPAAAIPQKEAAPASPEQQIEWTIHDRTDQRIEHICTGSLISVNNLVNCVLMISNESGDFAEQPARMRRHRRERRRQRPDHRLPRMSGCAWRETASHPPDDKDGLLCGRVWESHYRKMH